MFQQPIFGVYELDASGTVLYSRPYDALTGCDSETVGRNFFEDVLMTDTALLVRRKFKSFLSSRLSVDSFILNGDIGGVPLKARVMMARGHETQESAASNIVIMDIKRHEQNYSTELGGMDDLR